jgi:hypothetical protein
MSEFAVQDGYDERYAASLWSLVPATYRVDDSDSVDAVGPLQELLARIGNSVAVVRRSIDRLWDDQSIETCDTWVVPYLAELLATNLVPSMDARAQRLDVAKTIYYRRRKGTVALLEELTHDITGYETRVIEFFRQLARNHHSLDAAIGDPANAKNPAAAREMQVLQRLVGPLTHTPAGGWADLRNPLGAQQVGSAFDEFHHSVDVRRGQGDLGWYGISKVGFFLWRSLALRVDRATPVPVASCRGHYTFDPTGRAIPLFSAAARGSNDYGESWLPVPIWQLPMPLTETLWDAVARAHGPTPGPTAYPDRNATLWPHSLSVSALGSGDVLDLDQVTVWPEVGRFRVAPGAPSQLEVGYHHGLFWTVGAGPYDRRRVGVDIPADPLPVATTPGGSAVALMGALSALASHGTVVVTDGLTSSAVAPVGSVASPVDDVVVRASDEERAVIRLQPGDPPWVFTGASTMSSRLRLEGLLVSGADIVIAGEFDEVTLSCCTLDPGTSGQLHTPPAVWDTSVDGRPLAAVTVWVDGVVRRLVVDRCITGPIRTRGGGLIESLAVSDSIVQGLPTEPAGVIGRLRDADGLFRILRTPHDALSTWLSAQLSPAAATAVASHVDGAVVASGDQALVVSDLATVVNGPLLWTSARFGDRPLRDSTTAALADPTVNHQVLNRQLLAEAYPLALADGAIVTDAGTVDLERSTLLGLAYVHTLFCSESIMDDVVRVRNTQHGCVRFSAWATDSALPRRYESVRIAAGAPVMVSRRFGEWGYAQLHDAADAAILAGNTGGPPSLLHGSHDSSEMGAFCTALAAVKDRSLLIKLKEYLPIGLSPVLIHLPEADPEGELTRGRPWPPM